MCVGVYVCWVSGKMGLRDMFSAVIELIVLWMFFFYFFLIQYVCLLLLLSG